MKKIVKKAKDLMYRQTLKNDAPAWGLTEIAIAKGKKLAKKYKVDEDLVAIALYLAHTIFSKKLKCKSRTNHPFLSSKFVKPYLKKWKVSKENQKIIINGIEAHHAEIKTESLTAEVIKNAECFKFVTVKGTLILIFDYGRRGVSWEETIKMAKKKMRQKFSYLTLPDCKKEAKKEIPKILKILTAASKKH